MDLSGRKVIALGERDGVQGPAIAESVRSAGAEVVMEVTQCFVWTAAGALDLEGQELIQQAAEKHVGEDVVVVLGTPTPDSSEVYALTVTSGDPTWAGPLAGIALGMPVYHILEPEIKEQVDPAVYSEQVALSEMVLDSSAIAEVVHKVRNESSNSV